MILYINIFIIIHNVITGNVMCLLLNIEAMYWDRTCATADETR